MIYITKETKTIVIPSHSYEGADIYELQLVNSLTNSSYFYRNLHNISTTNQLFEFNLDEFKDILDLPEGEYKFALVSGLDLFEIGIMTVGDYKPNNKNYKQNNKKIIQYGG